MNFKILSKHPFHPLPTHFPRLWKSIPLRTHESPQLQGIHKHFAMRKATEPSQIYPVFRDLFKKEGAKAA